MGYRDDFYLAGNILGYTGELTFNPTVYFLLDLGGGMRRFGRITQDHKHALNIGRNVVRDKADYTVRNEPGRDGGMRCVERFDGRRKHTSRNTLILTNDMPAAQVALLAQSIYRFPDEKPKGAATALAGYADRYGEGAADALLTVYQATGQPVRVTR